MSLLILYLFVAIGVSFICSILEAVLLSITPSFVESKIEQNSRGGQRLKRVKDNLDQSISAILILNTFAHTMGAAGVGSQAVQLFGTQWESLIAVLLTLAILYLSEIIPKTLGASYWRSLAVPAARLISLLIKLVYPLVWLSSFVNNLFKKKDKDSVSRAEIVAFASLGYKGGVLGKQENQLVENILALKATTTEQILTPRSVVHAFDSTTTVSQALNHELTERFTRIPVYAGTIDNAIGIINNRNLLELEREGAGDKEIGDFTQPLHRIPLDLPVLHLIDQFIDRKEHIFLVEDQYGQTSGIVTLEDGIETLLGKEIVDETDITEDMQKLAKTSFRNRQ
ncbi:CNNM domain-containing protein [Desulforhopalus sp. 52FAK]